jgi:hypothetical protein
MTAPHRDYFISRSSVDAAFASWIGKLIAAQGKAYIDQSEHFGHEDFMNAMHRAFLSGARVVALYSQSYLDSKYCVREATEALKGDPANEQQRLIPLRIEPCAPAGMLNITYTDLLAERRQADASALATRICRALGLPAPDLNRLPPLPEGLLVAPPRLTDDDQSAEDHAWLDDLTRESAIDFAAAQGYDLRNYVHGGSVAGWWGFTWMILAEARGVLTPEKRAAAWSRHGEKT